MKAIVPTSMLATVACLAGCGTLGLGSSRPVSSPAATGLEEALVLEALADTAAVLGCPDIITDYWRTDAELIRPDSVEPRATAQGRRRAAAAVRERRDELDALCAAEIPLVGAIDSARARLRRDALSAPADGDPRLLRPIRFAFDADSLTAMAREQLDQLAAMLRERSTPVTLFIEGHGDGAEGSRYDYGLGLLRADAVARTLRSFGLPADCCVIVSGGPAPPRLRSVALWPDARSNGRVVLTLVRRTVMP